MFEIFEEYLLRQVTLTEQEMEMIKRVTITKKLRKKQYLLQEGDIARYQAFVCKGLLRMYVVKDDGAEHILSFAPENWWITDRKSFDTKVAAIANIEAIEDSEVLLWLKDDFERLFIDIPDFKSWREAMIRKYVDSLQHRIHSNISDTAEEKYIDFVKKYPNIYNRVPLHMIASYLGLSGKTLVRVRQHFASGNFTKD